jgi:uroporphyrin-III C-methyltransferase
LSDIPTTPLHPDAYVAEAKIPARPSSLPTASPSHLGGRRFWVALGVAALAFLVSLWSVQQNRADSQELAKRLQLQDNRLIESQGQAKILQDALRDAQAKLSIMENRVNEAAGQQAQLEKLYRALSNDSLDVALADLEGVILLAAQQAASGGSLQGPLIGLQAAEAKLDRLADPSLGNLKRALTKDVERIRLLSQQDTGGLAQRLEGISAQVDVLPLLSEARRLEASGADQKPSPKSGEKRTSPSKVSDGKDGAIKVPEAKSLPGKASDSKAALGKPIEASASAETTDTPTGLWAKILDVALGKGKVVGQDWRDLIRVTRVENPDAALLSPEQSYFVRENLRLRLLNARMALSSRQESVLKADLERSQQWLSSYFDTRDKQVAQAQEQIKQVLASRATNEPTLSFESLSVVRNLRSQREGRK